MNSSTDGAREASTASLLGTELARVDGRTWDAEASGFLDVFSEQTHCFGAARWGARRVECQVLRHGGEVVAGAVVVVVTVPMLKRGLAILKWGPVWRRRGQPVDPRCLRAALAALKEHYVDERGLMLTVKPPAEPGYSELWVNFARELGFASVDRMPHPDRYFVSLAQSPDTLRKGLHHKWRYNLKKAQKNGLEVKVREPVDALDDFMRLYEQMLARKRFDDYSVVGTLPSLLTSEVEALRPSVILVYSGGSPTAGAVVHHHGDRAVYLYGATDDRALRLKAGYVLQWWIVEWLMRTGEARWYDLGGTDGDAGLHQFKKGFVGRDGCILSTPLDFDAHGPALGGTVGKSIYALHGVRRQVHTLRDRVARLMP